MLKFEEVTVPQIWSKVSSFIRLDLIGATGNVFRNLKQGRAAIFGKFNIPNIFSYKCFKIFLLFFFLSLSLFPKRPFFLCYLSTGQRIFLMLKKLHEFLQSKIPYNLHTKIRKKILFLNGVFSQLPWGRETNERESDRYGEKRRLKYTTTDE